MKNLSIRILEHSDYAICQQIVVNQQLIWDIPAAEVVPFWKLMTLPSTGGVLVGAFDGDNIVGHAMLSPAVDPHSNDPFFYLDMVGVLPVYRNLGLAERMLQRAKAVAGERHISSIQWTFDPLEMANANLYIRKLGAQAVRFYPDYYGPPPEKNPAFCTDRFWVKWNLRAKTRTEKLPATILQFNQMIDFSTVESFAIALPDDFRQLATEQPERAAHIRNSSRFLFTHIFQQGFAIVDFFHSKNYYIAKRESTGH